MSFFQVACQYENMRIYVTDDYNDNNNDDVDVDNNSQVNLPPDCPCQTSQHGKFLSRVQATKKAKYTAGQTRMDGPGK